MGFWTLTILLKCLTRRAVGAGLEELNSSAWCQRYVYEPRRHEEQEEGHETSIRASDALQIVYRILPSLVRVFVPLWLDLATYTYVQFSGLDVSIMGGQKKEGTKKLFPSYNSGHGNDISGVAAGYCRPVGFRRCWIIVSDVGSCSECHAVWAFSR